MNIKYNDRIYKLGEPNTLIELKKKLVEQISELQNREIIIIHLFTQENHQILEEKNYKEILNMNKKEQLKLKCFILTDYLEKFTFEYKQSKQLNQIQQKQIEQLQLQIQNLKQPYLQNNHFIQIPKTLNSIQTQKMNQNKEQINNNIQIQNIDEFQLTQKIEYKQELIPSIISECQQNNYNQPQNQFKQNILQQSLQSQTINNRSELIFRDSARTNNIQSFAIEIYTNCMKCYGQIEDISIILSCQHLYHESCLKEILIQQIEQSYSCLNCQCNQKILHVKSLLRKLGIEQYFQKFLQNQLNRIKSSIQKIGKCQSKVCNFFVILDKNKKSQSFCPSCLMNVEFDLSK